MTSLDNDKESSDIHEQKELPPIVVKKWGVISEFKFVLLIIFLAFWGGAILMNIFGRSTFAAKGVVNIGGAGLAVIIYYQVVWRHHYSLMPFRRGITEK